VFDGWQDVGLRQSSVAIVMRCVESCTKKPLVASFLSDGLTRVRTRRHQIDQAGTRLNSCGSHLTRPPVYECIRRYDKGRQAAEAPFGLSNTAPGGKE